MPDATNPRAVPTFADRIRYDDRDQAQAEMGRCKIERDQARQETANLREQLDRANTSRQQLQTDLDDLRRTTTLGRIFTQEQLAAMHATAVEALDPDDPEPWGLLVDELFRAAHPRDDASPVRLGSSRRAQEPLAEQVARLFHDTYERLAPEFGYRTREASAKPWAEVPAQNRALMVATCAEVLAALAASAVETPEQSAELVDASLRRMGSRGLDALPAPKLATGGPIPKPVDLHLGLPPERPFWPAP